MSRLPRAVSSWIFNVSKGGNSKTSVGNLFHCLPSLAGRTIFLTYKENFLYVNLCQFVPIASCPVSGNHWQESALVFLFVLICYSHIDGNITNSFFLQAEQSRLSQPLLIWQVRHSLNHLHGPLLDLLPCSYASLVLRSPEIDTVIHNMIGNVFSMWK